MTLNDNALLLLAGGLAVATVIALVANLVGMAGWEDESLRQGVAFAAQDMADWSPTTW
jgi:hypothetical protein